MSIERLKFRAWDTKTKKMIYDGCCDSHPWDGSKYLLISFSGEICGKMDDDGGKNGLHEHDWDVGDRFILEQWTGLVDKNGKEIYEGDVLQWHNDTTGDSAILTIRWTEYNTCFQMCDDVNRKYFLALSGEGSRNSEIIGNVHDEVQNG